MGVMVGDLVYFKYDGKKIYAVVTEIRDHKDRDKEIWGVWKKTISGAKRHKDNRSLFDWGWVSEKDVVIEESRNRVLAEFMK